MKRAFIHRETKATMELLLCRRKDLAISIAIVTISNRNTINSDFIYMFPLPPSRNKKSKRGKKREMDALQLLFEYDPFHRVPVTNSSGNNN